jgi:phospholipid/cholesterol/gamma-HCH transport system permease protein
LITLQHHAPLSPFFESYFNNATPTELAGSLVKSVAYGGIIAIVCCYKGMTASGGAEGVGRAVNQAVVIAFMGIGTFNYVFTQSLLALNPDLSIVR